MAEKDLKRERTENYFKEAAKKIITEKGYHEISARNIAKEAGYSYATIYNYFRDIEELIFICIEDFFSELYDFIKEKSSGTEGKEELYAFIYGYLEFFIKNPEKFKTIFMYNFEKLPLTFSGENYVPQAIIYLTEKTELYLENNGISKEEAYMRISILSNVLNSELMFYIGKRSSVSEKEFFSAIKKQIEYILKK
ncbi:MAG TPA: TetR/AcrR family transcriptional regulator [Tepiditoga sp.]|nr:TetR/AcrR family transcriptional regulator [Thermotogota bacterium]HOO74300.1 TetR/AcrR family transcriptional regulator [Tepiditoga sp.]